MWHENVRVRWRYCSKNPFFECSFHEIAIEFLFELVQKAAEKKREQTHRQTDRQTDRDRQETKRAIDGCEKNNTLCSSLNDRLFAFRF